MPKFSDVQPLINANIETIDQGRKILESLPPQAYQFRAQPAIESCIGEHFRHIFDMYFALIRDIDSSEIDFNYRRRGAPIEHCVDTAKRELDQIRSWLLNLSGRKNTSIKMRSEVALASSESVSLDSSLARELMFVSSHAVHHYAFIGVIMKLQNLTVDAKFGVAAATASFQREKETQPAYCG